MNLRNIFLFILVILLPGPLSLQAQSNKFTLSGTVIDAKTGETIPYVTILVKELSLWTTSDVDGNFILKDIPGGEYTLEAKCLGFEEYSVRIIIRQNISKYQLKLQTQSLALEEVTVTATDARKMNSTSNISKTALEHLQAANIQDAMQLLPGSLTKNPQLTNVAKVTIRDISGTNSAISLGTSIIVDGAKISNDANMQMVSGGNPASSSTSGTGVDARQIPVDNIESIEVIRGVASAEYGDLNSGAVIVKTKAGKAPLEARFKTDPHLKQASLSKGFALGPNKGFLNFDADYARALSDIRTPSRSYGRGTLQIGYSNIFNSKGRAVSFNAKLNGSITMDKVKKDPDQSLDELTKSEDNKIGLNFFGNWMVKKPWLTSLEYSASGSYGRQYNRNKQWHSAVKLPNTNAKEPGEHLGVLLPYEYFSDLRIEGIPIYAQAKLTANVTGKYGKIYNNFMLGAEWTTKGNRGDGKTFDPHHPPAQNLRPRPFKDIPFIHEYTGFAEDKVIIPFSEEISFQFSAGVRLTNIATKAADYDITVDPRFNAKLTLIDRNYNREGIQYLSVRGGWGILTKMPTLAHLYPDPVYSDHISFNYNDDANNYNLTVITTDVQKTENPDLKLPSSRNMEIGLDLKAFGITGNFTYFKEKLTHAFTWESTARPSDYRQYNYDPMMGRPEYTNGEVTVNGSPVGYQTINTFLGYRRPGNGMTIDKWGIEYNLDFGKINPLQTSVIIDGAYFYQKEHNDVLQTSYVSDMVDGKPYPYMGIYAGGSGSGNGTKMQRLNTNIRLITHIPQLRLIVTLSGQCVWMDRNQVFNKYHGINMVYMQDDDGNYIFGDPGKDMKYLKCVNPVAYMDTYGMVHLFTDKEANDPLFQKMILKNRASTFAENDPSPYFMLNMRLTKEIGNYASLSFYANNFTNARPKRYLKANGMDVRMNSEIFFGAEISLKF